MANNLIQVKRTSVSGRAANTTTLTNPGELALNMTDGIMYSTNGSVVFEIGANNTNARVSGNLVVSSIVANSSLGTNNQVLTSNGTTVYWSTVSSGSTSVRQQFTGNGTNTVFTVTSGYTAYELDVYVNGVKLYNGTEVDVSSGTGITFTSAPPNGALIEVVGFTASNPSSYLTNTYSGTLSGNLTFSGANNVFNTGLKVGANVVINTSSYFVGNSTVNTNVSSGSITVGSNVVVNNTTMFVGNSTVNTNISANQITLNGSNVITTATVMKVYYANNTQAYP